MAEDTLITPEMREAVGREYRTVTSFPVSASDIRRWALAIAYPEPPPRLFWDADYAATTRFGGIVAPEDFNPFAWMAAVPRPDESPKGPTFLPEPALGLPLPQARANIIVGMDTEHSGVRMRPGDVIRSSSILASYSEKPGRMGLMLFTVMEDRWRNQHDELVRMSRTTLIRYR